MNCCTTECCGSGMRRFLTRDEKVQLLTEYKQSLEQEAKGIAERIQKISDE